MPKVSKLSIMDFEVSFLLVTQVNIVTLVNKIRHIWTLVLVMPQFFFYDPFLKL